VALLALLAVGLTRNRAGRRRVLPCWVVEHEQEQEQEHEQEHENENENNNLEPRR
jgi:hypothetical protein